MKSAKNLMLTCKIIAANVLILVMVIIVYAFILSKSNHLGVGQVILAYSPFFLVAVSMGLSSYLLLVSMKRRKKQIEVISTFADQLAKNQWESQSGFASKENLGDLYHAIETMQRVLMKKFKELHQKHDEAMRLTYALENVRDGVMLADKEHKIIYLNRSTMNILMLCEDFLAEKVPEFKSGGILEADLSGMLNKIVEGTLCLDGLNEDCECQVKAGSRILTLVVSPVFDEHSERIGTVVEWCDKTNEILVEKEMDSIVEAASHGDFTQRINTVNRRCFHRSLGLGINKILSITCGALDDTEKVLDSMSQGNFTKMIKGDYQGVFGKLKENVNRTTVKLTGTIEGIRTTSQKVNRTSHQLAKANMDLNIQTKEQISSLSITMQNIKKIAGMVKDNALQAKEVDELASCAQNYAQKGGEIVGDVIEAMKILNDSSEKISDIISVIDSIAFQTNLLALNAAVEAARAGEHGRGFAVVAGEVRSLAQRSAEAAREIKTLITDSVDKVEQGTKLAFNSGNALNEIVTTSSVVSEIIGKMALASQE